MWDQEQTNLNWHENLSKSYVVLATDNLSVTPYAVFPAKVGWTIYITRIQINITADAAKTNTIQDGNAVPIAAVKSSPGLGPNHFDFGANGMALTADYGLNHFNSGAGVACSVTVTAYRRRTPNQ